MNDVVSAAVRSRMMSSIRGRDTKPELVVRRFLHGRGFRFRLSRRDLPGRPDLTLPRRNAVVLVHGCFWHGHRGCRFATVPSTRREFWEAKIDSNRKRDADVVARLLDLGWRVGVVWECALKASAASALQRLEAFLLSNARQVEVSGAPQAPMKE